MIVFEIEIEILDLTIHELICNNKCIKYEIADVLHINSSHTVLNS